MMHYSRKKIDQLQHVYRINLINSCSGYKSANLLGSVSKDGITNVAVFSSVTHLGSNPPVLGFILRPTTIPRNTYNNIKQNEFLPSTMFTKIFLQMHITLQQNTLIKFLSLT